MDRAARNDAIGGLLIFVIVALFASVTSEIFVDPRDPGFGAKDFPVMVLGSMTALALALCARALIHLARTGWQVYAPGEMAPLLRYLLPIVALGSAYVWLLERFQYVLPTILVLTCSLAIFGNRGMVRLLLVPIVVTALFYTLFFGVFALNEPLGSILSYENGWFFRPFRKAIGL